MAKSTISVTLSVTNLQWLKEHAGDRGVSALLDQLVSSARRSAGGRQRSVVGTIGIDACDPQLEGADAAVQALFDASLARHPPRS